MLLSIRKVTYCIVLLHVLINTTDEKSHLKRPFWVKGTSKIISAVTMGTRFFLFNWAIVPKVHHTSLWSCFLSPYIIYSSTASSKMEAM